MFCRITLVLVVSRLPFFYAAFWPEILWWKQVRPFRFLLLEDRRRWILTTSYWLLAWKRCDLECERDYASPTRRLWCSLACLVFPQSLQGAAWPWSWAYDSSLRSAFITKTMTELLIPMGHQNQKTRVLFLLATSCLCLSCLLVVPCLPDCHTLESSVVSLIPWPSQWICLQHFAANSRVKPQNKCWVQLGCTKHFGFASRMRIYIHMCIYFIYFFFFRWRNDVLLFWGWIVRRDMLRWWLRHPSWKANAFAEWKQAFGFFGALCEQIVYGDGRCLVITQCWMHTKSFTDSWTPDVRKYDLNTSYDSTTRRFET